MTLLVLSCLWVIAGVGVAMLPMRYQYVPGAALLLAAPVLIYLIGQDAALLADALEGNAAHVACDSMQAAVEQAAKDAARDTSEQSEIAVLLSPACASFDQYPNFEMRGDDFRACVLALDGVQQQTKVA